MKTITIEVPRLLVKSHHHHPEPYGESIVVLINDMYTDVYTEKSGKLVTITNDKELVNYLKRNFKSDPTIRLQEHKVELSTIKNTDKELLKEWLSGENNWLKTKQDYSEEDVAEYISHSITALAHQFLLKISNKPIGQLGFQIIDDDIILNLSVYEEIKDNESIILAVKLLIDYLSKSFVFSTICISVASDDHYHKRVLNDTGFVEKEGSKLDVNVSENKTKSTSTYVLNIK